MSKKKQGLLIINLGTTDQPTVKSVRKFLRAFLSDPNVIDIPQFFRWVLLNFWILPFRPYSVAKAYQSIWTAFGSPLRYHSEQLQEKLQSFLGEQTVVVLGMRYGKPSLIQALDLLIEKDCSHWVVLPLFPQYAFATTGSIYRFIASYLAKKKSKLPPIAFIKDFYDYPLYVKALANQVKLIWDKFQPDHLLMSYHGVPVRQLKCHLASSEGYCVKTVCQGVQSDNRYCYRAQCYATSSALVQALKLDQEAYTISFQSRLGRIPWIKPYTDEILSQLIAKQIKRLAVICPSFMSDCLETDEEIGIRLKEKWIALGGEDFQLIPCLNASLDGVSALAALAKATHRFEAFQHEDS